MNKAIVAIQGKPPRPSGARTAAQAVVQDSCHYKRSAVAGSSSVFYGEIADIVGQFVLFPLLLAETVNAVFGHLCPAAEGRQTSAFSENFSY
jgi:hypothetical protein